MQFLLAILGASGYTYAEASMSQQKEDFINSVENALILRRRSGSNSSR